MGKPKLPDLLEQPLITADEAFRLLKINRKTGYKAIQQGTFPLLVIRVGRLIRVPTVPLLKLINPDDSDDKLKETKKS